MLPTGYSFNLDGTTLYLSLASVFVAQLAGVELTLGQQLVMMLTLMLTSKGVAGVPRAALVVLTATLTQFGLPLEGRGHPARHRPDHGHGPHGGERHGQLHRHGGRRALGRRVRRRADAGVCAAARAPTEARDADRGRRRARAARRGGRARVRARGTTSSPLDRAALDITDAAAVRRAVGRAAART